MKRHFRRLIPFILIFGMMFGFMSQLAPLAHDISMMPIMQMSGYSQALTTDESEWLAGAFEGSFTGQTGLFSQDSSIYNHELATLAAELSHLAYAPAALYNRLVLLGMSNIRRFETGVRWQLQDFDPHYVEFTVGLSCVERNNNIYNLIIVVVRGTSTTYEWISNFIVNQEGEADAHHGFELATARLLDDLLDYLPDDIVNNPENNIFLITGHSRGGAASNLLASVYRHRLPVRYENLFTYTFAAPNTMSPRYYAADFPIFNIVNVYDLVPRVPTGNWIRAGTDKFFYNFSWVPVARIYFDHCHEMHLNWMRDNTSCSLSVR